MRMMATCTVRTGYDCVGYGSKQHSSVLSVHSQCSSNLQCDVFLSATPYTIKA